MTCVGKGWGWVAWLLLRGRGELGASVTSGVGTSVLVCILGTTRSVGFTPEPPFSSCLPQQQPQALGVPAALLLAPAICLVGCALIIARPTPGSVAGFEVARKVYAYAVTRPAREVRGVGC